MTGRKRLIKCASIQHAIKLINPEKWLLLTAFILNTVPTMIEIN